MDSPINALFGQSHPLTTILAIQAANHLLSPEFEYSVYVPGPPGTTLERTINTIPGKDIEDTWLKEVIESLDENEEVAWHSRVYVNGEIYHIPMIDFSVQFIAREEILPRIDDVKAILYNSGRSIHAYYPTLLTDEKWHKFLGQVLLLNPSGSDTGHIVDCRWIGHSLEHGFSALRWTQNTSRYLTIPSLIECVA